MEGIQRNVTEQRGTRNNGIVSKTITWNATQTTFCTCKSTNLAGTSTASVTTSILYPPVIKQTENKTVNEGDSTVLQCGAVHANPPVNLIRWTYGRYNVTNVTLAISNVSRSDVKVYTCTAINTMHPSCQDVVYGSSSKSIHIEVLCKPRADKSADVQFNVTSAINRTVSLSYTASAYPHPSFQWYRNGSIIKTRDSHFSIFSTDLQTNLTIPYVEERDFGEYTLIVSNDIGSIKESFQLKPDGVPEVPTDLKQDESRKSDLVIALNWKSGFNNGSKQNFTLMYSKQTEENWQSVNVQDTGPTGMTIQYNIQGLSSDTSYDIVLFAVNAKGRSKPNVTLTCSTNPILEDTGHASIIGAAVGSAASLLIIGVVIAGVVIYRKRNIKQPECSTIHPQIPVTYENLTIVPIPNEPIGYHRETAYHITFETNVDHTYEDLSREDSGKENEHMCLGEKTRVDPHKTYENLKIQLGSSSQLRE